VVADEEIDPPWNALRDLAHEVAVLCVVATRVEAQVEDEVPRWRGLQTFRNGTHKWCDLLIALVEVAAELYVERPEIWQIDHAEPGVGLLKVYRRTGSIDGRPPAFLALSVPECRDPITSRPLPGWNLRRWVCPDCPRYGPAVRELQLKLEAIGMPREANRVQSLGAV